MRLPDKMKAYEAIRKARETVKDSFKTMLIRSTSYMAIQSGMAANYKKEN